MSDEPSLGEVVRGLDKLEKRLEQFIREFSLRVVDTAVYGRDQREWERRFTEMQRDIEQVREAGEKAVKAITDRLDAQTTSKRADWRQVVFNGLVPGISLLLTLLVTILLAFKGGK